jgi:hypothetical protein
LDKPENLEKYSLQCNPKPDLDCRHRGNLEVVKELITVSEDGRKEK